MTVADTHSTNTDPDAPSLMDAFDFQLRTRMIFGPDSINRLGELAGEIGTRRALVVTDPGIVEAGHVEKGLSALKAANIETHVFDGAQENPTTENVDQALAVAKRFEPELLIGLGGGSSMDCAKGVNFLYSNGGRMQDYWGVGKALKEMLPMIAVPTTAGTGSEMQSFALISDAETHVKMACGDKKASCRMAILDPILTLTQPSLVTALTAVDALSHALETYVTRKRNKISLVFSMEAWRLIATNLRRVFDEPDSLESRGRMQLGAAYCGVAIENSMLGGTHALANPLTATYGIAHGQAIGVMLPHVIRFNGHTHGQLYQEMLFDIQGTGPDVPKVESGAAGLADFVASLIAATGLSGRLSDLGVSEEKIPEMAAAAAKQWTGTFNPRPLDIPALEELYRAAL
ncbi:MAG: iron-containing alcohol dehydrogenase [Planctomycetota bacterium]